MNTRRAFLLGIGAALAAPAIVRAESLMRIAVLRDSVAPPLQSIDSGYLWEGRVKRGTWIMMGGLVSFRYEYLDAPNDVYRQAGENHKFDSAYRVFKALGVEPYQPLELRFEPAP